MNHLVMDHRCTINDKPRHELDVLILPAHPESRNVYQCKQTCRFMMNHISPITTTTRGYSSTGREVEVKLRMNE